MELTFNTQTGIPTMRRPHDGGTILDASTLSQERQVEERLPFTVKIVRSDTELEKAVHIRHSAYDRHMPQLAALLENAEAMDYQPGSIVLLAESQLDGTPIGTMRIQTNRHNQLALEKSVDLPQWLDGTTQAEATRLGVINQRVGRLVKIALFKAYFQYCQLDEIDWMVIAARSPLDRTYVNLLFTDVIPSGEFIPMRHAGNIPHRVLAFNISRAESLWRENNHPLYNFVFKTHHPDINLTGVDYLPMTKPGNSPLFRPMHN